LCVTSVTYIPTENFEKGKNILRVDKIGDKENTDYRAMVIPFWYEGKNKLLFANLVKVPKRIKKSGQPIPFVGHPQSYEKVVFLKL